MPRREHSAILSTFIKLHFVFKTFVLYIFEWLLKTGTVINTLEQTASYDTRAGMRWRRGP